MKLINKMLLSGLLLLVGTLGYGQTIFQQSQTFSTTVSSVSQPGVPEFSLGTTHTLIITTTGTAVGTVTLQTASAGTTGPWSTMTGAVGVSVATSTSYTIEGSATTAAYVGFLVNISTCTSCTVTVTYLGTVNQVVANLQDGVYNVPLGACGAALTTGAYAANPANSGALSAPALVRTAAGEQALEVTTSAAASALTVDCDLTLPTRLTTGKGVTVTGYNFFYGNQTSALTSITLPVVNTITFPAPPSATPLGTVATAGGTITLNPVAPTLTTTTAGLCNAFNATFATPVALNSGNVKLETTIVLNQTVAATTVYQVCGVQVLYQNNPL